jgi:hypothetical protein
MDPLVLILVPGILGGIAIAFLVILNNRRARSRPAVSVANRLESVSPHMINMASIRVVGIGGLGLVAMCVVVALGVPEIRQRMAISLALGVVVALVMILRARRAGGPMPSSGQRMGANTMLSIDEPLTPPSEPGSSAPGTPHVRLVSA